MFENSTHFQNLDISGLVVRPNILLFVVEVLYSQNFGWTNNCVAEVFLKWSNQSCSPSTTAPVFP